ncbi:aldo/keto reductase [Leucobacter sp.]
MSENSTTAAAVTAPAAATTPVAGRSVRRLVFGGARLTRLDGWGAPQDPEASKSVLRAALDAGFDAVDTADALGPGISETLIGEVVGDRSDVLVSTKVGMLRPGPTQWDVLGHPNYLRQQVHASLSRLRREQIDLLYLHRIDPDYPLADQLGALQDLRDQGLVGSIGVSEPTAEQLEDVLRVEPGLAAVQSVYNVAAPGHRPLIGSLAERGIPFVGYWPLIGRGLPAAEFERVDGVLRRFADDTGLTPTQLKLAWIFATAPNTLAVVGSRSPQHLVENLAVLERPIAAELVPRIEHEVREALGGFSFDPRYGREEQA